MNNESCVVALCDDETEYAFHLGEYLKSAASFPLRLRIFTGAEKLLSLLDPKNAALLVIAESEYTKKVQEAGFASVLILSESGETGGSPKRISKYQPMDGIAKEVFALCGEKCAEQVPAGHSGRPLQKIGLFSPAGGVLQTTFALTLAEVLSENCRVLYVNLEPFPGLAAFFGKEEHRGNLRELLYTAETDPAKFPGQLSLLSQKAAGFDIVPPLPSAGDFAETTGEDWIRLLEAFEGAGDYEYLILDFSCMVQGLPEILSRCDRVYTLSGTGAVSREKILVYQEYLKASGQDRLVAATRFVELPVFSHLPGTPEQLGSGELASFIRSGMDHGEL